jgi:GT2 family glycosyltransferase
MDKSVSLDTRTDDQISAAAAASKPLSTLGIVVIGRNEGERLRRCLESVSTRGFPVFYVDSGSTDGSTDLAISLGVKAAGLDDSCPFTAARARNEGFRRLLDLNPDVELVQFVDGDCEVVSGWVAAAERFMHEHPEVAVVCGRRREIDPHRNIYHRWIDMEWDTPVGEADYCGGDAMVRTSAFREVGGYRDDLIAGEDPEFCVRLRQAGWKIWRIDEDMTRHDIRMHSFGQWWRRTVRNGHAYAEGAYLHRNTPQRHWLKESRRIWFWGLFVPSVSIFLAWPTYGLSLLAMAAIYLLLFIKVAAGRLKRGCAFGDSLLYAFFCVVSKWPQAEGQFQFVSQRWTGRRAKLIEYSEAALSQKSVNH